MNESGKKSQLDGPGNIKNPFFAEAPYEEQIKNSNGFFVEQRNSNRGRTKNSKPKTFSTRWTKKKLSPSRIARKQSDEQIKKAANPSNRINPHHAPKDHAAHHGAGRTKPRKNERYPRTQRSGQKAQERKIRTSVRRLRSGSRGLVVPRRHGFFRLLPKVGRGGDPLNKAKEAASGVSLPIPLCYGYFFLSGGDWIAGTGSRER
jgi:hypothetical protein